MTRMPFSRLHRHLAAAGLAGVVILSAGAARADAIDGNWCNSTNNRQMQISGPMIVTPGGTKMEGRYSRHSFAYTVPQNEPSAGDPVSLQLVNENRIAAQFGAAPVEMWHRCEQTS